MSVIYMKHPQHGTKVATAEAEADADEKNGWVRFDIMALETTKADAADIHDIDVLRKKYEDKHGTKPDGRWKADRLLMELA